MGRRSPRDRRPVPAQKPHLPVNTTALQWAGKRPAGAEWFDTYRAWLKGMG